MNSIEFKLNGIAHHVQSLVGSIGESRTTVLSNDGQPGDITVSRGGLVVPSQTYGEHYEAKRRDHVFLTAAGSFNIGDLAYPDAGMPEEALFDPSIIHLAYIPHRRMPVESSSVNFLMRQDPIDTTWLAYLLDGLSVQTNPYLHINTYFLGSATRIETEDNVAALKGLLTIFEGNLHTRQAESLEFTNAPILQS